MGKNREVTPDPSAMGAFEQFLQSISEMGKTPVTAAMIAGLPDSELDDHVWLRLIDRGGTDSRDDIEALHPLVRAYYATRMFEWEVGNGGLRQYFLNFADRPWFLPLVLDGYTELGLDDQRHVIEERIVPVAFSAEERRNRSRDRIDIGKRDLGESRLDELDDLIGEHDDVRVALIRANPALFTA